MLLAADKQTNHTEMSRITTSETIEYIAAAHDSSIATEIAEYLPKPQNKSSIKINGVREDIPVLQTNTHAYIIIFIPMACIVFDRD